MSSVMEVNLTLQTVHTSQITTVLTQKMQESDVPVSSSLYDVLLSTVL